MNMHRDPRRYELTRSVEVRVDERSYFVFTDAGVVVQEVVGKGGARVVRRVGSLSIAGRALVQAADGSRAAT